MIYLLIISMISGIFTDFLLMKTLKLKKYPFTAAISILTMLIMSKVFDINNLMIIKGFVFSQILIFAGIHDIKTKTIPDTVHILILLLGLIKPHRISLAGLVAVPFPFFISALIKPGSIGGGDIKLMAACGFILGVWNGIAVGIIGLLLAVLVNTVYYKIKGKNITESFALAPYLGIGCFIGFLNL